MGVVSELARLIRLGFPEETAKRIVSGELDMSKEARMDRAFDQGFDPDEIRFHATNADIGEFDADRIGGGPGRTPKTFPQGFYFGRNPNDLEDYYSSEGGNIIPVLLRRGEVESGTDFDAFKRFNEGDADTYRSASGVEVVKKPSNIRSTNAAFDPQYKGANILGSALLPAATAGLLATQSDDAEAGFVTRGGKTLLEAWHGSPHKFDKFSMDQIGTGEGAQAYGHGLYFADDIDEAKRYQPRDYGQEDELYRFYQEAEEAGDQYMMDAWERAMLQDSPIELRASAADPDYDEYSQAAFAKVADYLESNPGQGSLLRAEIDVTPESMIDWEKSLKEQPEFNEALRRLGYFDEYPNDDLSDHVTGSMAYGGLFDLHGDVKRNQMLLEEGIQGLSYPADNSTRGQNYVIFDDSLINIAERGNATPEMIMALALGSGGATAAASEGLGTRLMNHIGDNVNEVLDLLEKPQRGLQGLIRAGYGLTQGESLDAALNAGADVVNNGVEAAAEAAGDKVLEETGSPELAAMAYMAAILGSPI